MSLLITGSIATDHLMSYAGKFSDSLVADQLDKISVSFLANDLEVRRGGVAPNICFGLAKFGLTPILVGSAGKDFAEYRNWLTDNGVDCDSVLVAKDLHTARFVCTTDQDLSQIASFYPGAMTKASEISLATVVKRTGTPDYVLVGPNDPQAMLQHTAETLAAGYKLVADPGQQLSFGDGEMIKQLITGATYLFSNEYESHLISEKTGLTEAEILGLVGTKVTTLGADGVRITSATAPAITVPALTVNAVEPTGVGDGFRAGFLAALSWGLDHVAAAQTGCTLASYVVETTGTQEYSFTRSEFFQRFTEAYGSEAAAKLNPAS